MFTWFSDKLIHHYNIEINEKNVHASYLNNQVVNLTNEVEKLKKEYAQDDWYRQNYNTIIQTLTQHQLSTHDKDLEITALKSQLQAYHRTAFELLVYHQNLNSALTTARNTEQEKIRLYNLEKQENETLELQTKNYRQQLQGAPTASEIEAENGRRELEQINQIIMTLRADILQIRERHAVKVLEIQAIHTLKVEAERDMAGKIERARAQLTLNANASDVSSETNPLIFEEDNF